MKIIEPRLPISSAGTKGAFFWRSSVVVMLALTLSGCIPTADVPNPALDVPASFRAGGTGHEASPPKFDWWTGFRSPELDRLMWETATSNFDIAAAVARIHQADAAARIVGAALLPSLTANDSVTKSLNPSINFGAGTRTIYSSLFNASYVVDFWGRNRGAYEAAIATSSYRRYDRDTIRLTAIASAAVTYFAILGARERITFAKQDLSSATGILKLIQDRATYGTATALNVAQQQALVDNVRASIPPLQQIVDQNIAALALLLGEPPQRLSIAATSLTGGLRIPHIAPGLPSQLLLERPDVQSAEALLLSAHANLVSARAAFFPQIALTGVGGFESAALQSLFSPGAGLYSVAASLSQPIFDGGVLLGTFDQQKGVQEETLAVYRKAVVAAFSDVEKALVALRETGREEAMLKQSLVASRKAYDLAEEQLRVGTIDYVTLLQTQQTLFTTLDTLSQARLAHFQAAVTLYQALGGGIPWQARNDKRM
ncbi:MAG: efflux transporter outer membrane subunit [Methylovirgula sp.]